MKSQFLYITLLLIKLIECTPFDDGRYYPDKYSHNAGKYNRPTNEGKYVPSDEGRYTYIYRQGLYPTDDRDYKYVHLVGPNGGGDGPSGRNGGFGSNGGFGGEGGYGASGGYGPDGGFGPGGPNGPNGPKGPGGPNGPAPRWYEYIGHRIYADKYPYLYEVIEALIDKFVSKNYLLDGDGTENFYKKMKASNGTVQCQYVEPTQALDMISFVPLNETLSRLKNDDNIGKLYNFKGMKSLITFSDAAQHTKKTVKLEYDLTVRIVNEITETLA